MSDWPPDETLLADLSEQFRSNDEGGLILGRLLRSFCYLDITTVGEARELNEGEFYVIPNFGIKSFRTLIDVIGPVGVGSKASRIATLEARIAVLQAELEKEGGK